MVYAVSISDLTKNFQLGKNVIPALRGVDLDVEKETFSALMGPSGSGKTTLLNIIGGLERPTSGIVFVDGINLSFLSARDLAKIRSEKIGYVHQTFDLQPVLTAQENVELPLIIAGQPREKRKKRATDLLQIVGLEGFERNRPNQLSGGQQQRVAIARSLANDPVIILADEPTANLDLRTGTEILSLLRDLNRGGKTLIIATHDIKLLNLVDHVITIQDGKSHVRITREELSPALTVN